tara:strand:- start:1791 stop:2210 length:420 start_codon:yes stop_codon:yes gene_type:complete
MQAATDTIVLMDSTTPEKRKFDIQNVYETTLAKLKVKVSAITIRSSTLHLIIKYVMELVEQTPLKGSEQKEMALKLFRALIVDFTDAEDERVLLQLLNDGTIGNMIDLIVDATRGRLDINTAVQVTTGCLNRCIPYLCL